MIDVVLTSRAETEDGMKDIVLYPTVSTLWVLNFILRVGAADPSDIILYPDTNHSNYGQNLYPVTATRTKIAASG